MQSSISKYRITKRVGGGSFGDIYLGVGANGEKVAVKFEKHGARCPQLRHEYKVYRELQNAPGFAKVHYFGTQDSYNLMVMDLLGPSLEDQFNKCGRRFSLKTVLMIADQMLERVELMHSRHLIHRDIKPANFVTDGGRGSGNFIYCIDFGLSKRYRHPRTLQHIPQREGRSLTGTPRYASINNHLGVEQSRRDDLESIGYVLVYFLKGGLPWQGLKAKSATKKYKLIMEKKQSITIPALCQGCPSQFAEYLAYCRSLKFEAKPNIAYLRGMFRDLFRSQGYTNNNSSLDWDWNRVDPGAGSADGRGERAGGEMGYGNDAGVDGITIRDGQCQGQRRRRGVAWRAIFIINMRDPPTNYTDEDHDAESNDDSDEEYEDDQYLDEEYGDEYLDRHSLIELSSIRDPRLPYEHDNIGSRHSRPKSCCSGRQKACIIVSLLFIIYLVAKYDVDEVKWVVTEIESDLLGSRCINASFIQSERNIEPVVADTVPVDYNFSTFEPLGGGRFTEYKDGESPFDVTEEMKSESDRVALSRRLHVVNAMKHVWENYKERAFGMDELLPISGKGIDNWGSLGTTLVDSLDTLWIMGLKTEFQEGRDWVKEHLSHTLVGEVSTFETTTRILGGLISAYDLSDDTIFLKKAEYLAPRLFHAFESASGLPNGVVDLSVRTGKSHLSGHSYVLSEVASLQLEFGFMAKSTGKQDYRTKSEKVFDILQRISPRDGLMPLNLKEKRNGQAYFSNTVVSFGKGGPAYCYMLKMWLMGGKKDKKYRDLWDKSINGMHHHLLKKSIPNGLTYIVDRSNNRAGNEMSHQTCSIGGLLALGAYTDPEGMNSPRSERDLKTAKALAYTCYQMHARSATGLSPESVTFNDCTDFAISKSNPVYMLRSEAVESWYYLHELTGDPIYREWGWEVFLAIERYCKSQYGYASLKNVDLPSLHQIDKMESFFLAKTLKFLFLLFDPSSDIDIMSKHVFNTEAHVLQVFSG